MRSSILFLLAALSTAVVAVPTTAQTIRQTAQCTDENNICGRSKCPLARPSLHLATETGSVLSKVYENRAYAFDQKNDTDHAIADY